MRAQLLKLLDTALRNFWALPGFMMACGIGLYIVTAALDGSGWVKALQQTGIVYGGSFEDARTILQVIAETMVAIASLAFATVAVVLTLATGQFGHRLVRSFMRDKPTQVAFGIFVTTFIYSLLVLYAVRGSGSQASAPDLSVSVAFYLAIISGATLIYFTHHIAQLIEAPAIIAEVGAEMDATIARSRPKRREHPNHTTTPDDLQALQKRLKRDGESVTSARCGYVQTLDTSVLLHLATEHDLVIEVLHRPGDYLLEGTVVARILGAERGHDGHGKSVLESMTIGHRRTPVQDLRFVFNQLAEIAVRAMSPALNDPFTALDCVNRLVAGFASLARGETPSACFCDERGCPRVLFQPLEFDELIHTALTPVRNYSKASVIVSLQLLVALKNLAPLLQDDTQRRAVAFEAELVRRDAERTLTETRDRETLRAACEATLRELGIDSEKLA